MVTKEIENDKINIVIKLSIKSKEEHKDYLNSIITGHKTDNKRVEKYLKKHQLLYKK